MGRELVTTTLVKVRFSDVDSMGIVWHGKYIRYFEDGREDFGEKFNLTYLDFYKKGVLIPVVKVDCEYKKPLAYGDTAEIETRFIEQEAARIRYEYVIRNHRTGEIAATGFSIQVFLNMERELLLAFPDFLNEWKEKHLGMNNRI